MQHLLILHSTAPGGTGADNNDYNKQKGRKKKASGNNESSEWKAVLAALKLYKAAFGDLKVPQLFVVPTMAPWPKPSWGMKLGKAVGNIRSTGKYIQQNSDTDEATATERRQILENLGFAWRVRQDKTTSSMSPEQVPLEQLYNAFEAYRDNIVVASSNNKADGTWTVPPNFVVPDLDPWPDNVRGLPLGRQLINIKRRLAKNKDMKEKFQKLGLSDLAEKPPTPNKQMSANDIRFQNVYAALKTYKELYGDLLVPQPFAVPKTNEWPEETWGLRLGARVNAVRSQGTFVNNNPERRQMLDDLGFVWSTPKDGSRRRGRKPRTPGDDAAAAALDPTGATILTPPPTASSGTQAEIDTAGKQKDTSAAVDSLFDGSFDFGKDFYFSQDGEKTSPTWGLVDGGRELQEAAVAAEEAARAEEEYLPPRTLADSLKEATERAIDVGVIEGLTDNKRVIKGKREKDIPWFNDDFGDYFVFEDVVEALTIYKSIYGDFKNLTESDEFVVPTPKEVTGFLDEDDDGDDAFGQFDADASARAAAAIARFEEQGDVESSEDLIAAEVERLQTEVGQLETAVETTTSVSKETSTDQWPEHLSSMALGSIVARIRDGSLEVRHLPERKAQLDELNFDWGDPMYFIDVPFEKAMCAMYAYYLIRGDMFVYEDFVMPDEDPWPQALAGYEIGMAVKRIRELQNFLEAYHPEKVSLLRMIDFVWFPTMALPLDPNETEMNSEMLMLSAMGHPDYAKMIDIPMGLPDKIIADGPFNDSDDPKLWWRKWHNWDYVKDYWYQQGRRDNAYVLRNMGYPRMAEEHEEKYGSGLFAQINETLEEIDAGIDDRSTDEKRDILEKLNFFRQEILGCKDIHPRDRNVMLADFDTRMLAMMEDDTDLQNLVNEDDDDLEDSEEEDDDFDPDDSGYISDKDVIAEGGEEQVVVDEDFEIDVDDELGLDDIRQ